MALNSNSMQRGHFLSLSAPVPHKYIGALRFKPNLQLNESSKDGLIFFYELKMM